MSFIKLPGLIDPHVHLRTPGQEYKEDFYTGTMAALAGGFTTIIDMPNNIEPITTLNLLMQKQKLAATQSVCCLGFHFGSLGENLDEFPKIFSKVCGLKLYLNETTGNFLINIDKLEHIFTAWNSEKPILVHAEDDAVWAVIKLVRKLGKRVHFCHISTIVDLQHIINAKEDDLPITCGVTPHHLFLTEDNMSALGPFSKMKPPLQSKKEQDFLWRHLSDIDIVESDHAPHTILEKESEDPPYGVPGLETTLPLLLTAVSQGRLSIDEIIRLCNTGPAKIFNIFQDKKTYIQIDVNQEWEIRNENLQTKCKWTPYNGWKVKGKVKKVFLRGTKVFEDDKILVKKGSGNIIP